MIPVPAWLILTALLLALVMVPVLVLTGAWIAHRARHDEPPLPSLPLKVKVTGPQARKKQQPAGPRPDLAA